MWDLTNDDEIVLQLNGEQLEGIEVNNAFTSPEEGQWLECDLTSDQVVRGKNAVELSLKNRTESQQAPLVLNTVQLKVRY